MMHLSEIVCNGFFLKPNEYNIAAMTTQPHLLQRHQAQVPTDAEANEQDFQYTERLDHLGLVAATCQDLKIAERINARIGSKDPRRVVQPGVAIVAAILNGLGFSNSKLYLTPQFFECTPVATLLNQAGLEVSDLNDHAIGKALDEVSAYGVERLFGEIVCELMTENNLFGNIAHLDSTSFKVHGQYEHDDAMATIEVCHGHSKDHRPDLKQVMCAMVTNGPAHIPMWLQPQNGNSSDQTSFHEIIKRVRRFQKEVKSSREFRWIADAALYVKDKLLKEHPFTWISRVPERIKECARLLEQGKEIKTWSAAEGGYRYRSVQSCYGGIQQRWLVVFSEQAYESEKKIFDKKLMTQQDELEKYLWHLSHRVFSCPEDALLSIKGLDKKYPFYQVKAEVMKKEEFLTRGRPSSSSVKKVKGYVLSCRLVRDEVNIQKALEKKGCFVLATNACDEQKLPDCDILQEYKSQQNIERGFRFLKDPWFMANKFFVKNTHRIEALMMVMSLSLVVYNYAQYKLRSKLIACEKTLPNQKGKPIQNPTLRWIFQLMRGVSLVKVMDPESKFYKKVTDRLTDVRRQIIRLWGETACRIYAVTYEPSVSDKLRLSKQLLKI